MKQTEKNTYTEEEIEELKKWFESQQLPGELALDKATYIPNLRDTLDRLLEQAKFVFAEIRRCRDVSSCWNGFGEKLVSQSK